jgi:hypothetical protein
MTLRKQITDFLRAKRIFLRLEAAGINITSLRDPAKVGRAITRVRGNTWPVRETLRAMGGTWNPVEQAWDFPILHGNDWGTLVRALRSL